MKRYSNVPSKWIVMGRDECDQEFRCSSQVWTYEGDAYDEALEMYDTYPEARAIWVEQLKDKDYYIQRRSEYVYD